MISLNCVDTRAELADFLGVPLKTLTYILYIKKVDTMYTSFAIPKKSGGERVISAPMSELKDIQKKLAVALWTQQQIVWEQKNIYPNISHAFEKNKSIFTNAKIHRNKRFILNIDLENFFDSFHFGRVRGYFEKNSEFKLPIDIATIIAQLSCYNGKLPQGSPCSPIITNLICQVLDMRILKIAKKHKLDYTRYADDLTFSTNDKIFLDDHEHFLHKIEKVIEHSGFKVNEKKTRLLFRDSRQEVTGLIVNKKINIDSRYYKATRAMANSLYATGNFKIDGADGTAKQLEGRFSFIDQAEKYNNINDGKAPAPKNRNNRRDTHNLKSLSAREEQYRKFLFYKYFMASEKPLIITEGKTDIIYIKSALKNLYSGYSNLITPTGDNSFSFKVSFLNKTDKLSYLMGICQDGADTMKNVYNLYSGKESLPNYMAHFKEKFGIKPKTPVILLFDNEIDIKGKPLYKFVAHVGMAPTEKTDLLKNYYAKISDNLFIVTTPLFSKKETEIEDLFDNIALSHEIDGRKFSRKGEKGFYGKETFSKYISSSYKDIDFGAFKPLLDNISEIINTYQNEG